MFIMSDKAQTDTHEYRSVKMSSVTKKNTANHVILA